VRSCSAGDCACAGTSAGILTECSSVFNSFFLLNYYFIRQGVQRRIVRITGLFFFCCHNLKL
jgi:hypothetical protein